MSRSEQLEYALSELLEQVWRHAPPEIDLVDVDGRARLLPGWFEGYLDQGVGMTRDAFEQILLVLRPKLALERRARSLFEEIEKARMERARFLRDVRRHADAFAWQVLEEGLLGEIFLAGGFAKLEISGSPEVYKARLVVGRFGLSSEASTLKSLLEQLWVEVSAAVLLLSRVVARLEPRSLSGSVSEAFPDLVWSAQGEDFVEGVPAGGEAPAWRVCVLCSRFRPLPYASVEPYHQATLTGLNVAFGRLEGATAKEAVERLRERLLEEVAMLRSLICQVGGKLP